jgi:hypothetical protein
MCRNEKLVSWRPVTSLSIPLIYVEGKIACLPAALNFADVSSLLQYPQSNLRSPSVVLSDLSFDLRRKIDRLLATPKRFMQKSALVTCFALPHSDTDLAFVQEFVRAFVLNKG